MLQKRKSRIFIKKIFLYFAFCLVFLGLLIVFLSPIFWNKKQVFINPLSGINPSPTSALENLLYNSHIQYDSISQEKNFSVVSLRDNGQIIFSYEKNLNDQISSLQAILKQLTIEGKRFKNLDFRFDKPVVSF